MQDILQGFSTITTKRLLIAPLTVNDYVSITELYEDIKNNPSSAGVFSEMTEINVEKLTAFDSAVRTGFNLTAKTCDKNEFTAYLKGSILGKTAWIYVFIVEPSKRRSGYGSEMLSVLSNYLKMNCFVKEIRLSVLDKNENAASFWRSQGFEQCSALEKSGICGKELSKINIFVKLL